SFWTPASGYGWTRDRMGGSPTPHYTEGGPRLLEGLRPAGSELALSAEHLPPKYRQPPSHRPVEHGIRDADDNPAQDIGIDVKVRHHGLAERAGQLRRHQLAVALVGLPRQRD